MLRHGRPNGSPRRQRRPPCPPSSCIRRSMRPRFSQGSPAAGRGPEPRRRSTGTRCGATSTAFAWRWRRATAVSSAGWCGSRPRAGRGSTSRWRRSAPSRRSVAVSAGGAEVAAVAYRFAAGSAPDGAPAATSEASGRLVETLDEVMGLYGRRAGRRDAGAAARHRRPGARAEPRAATGGRRWRSGRRSGAPTSSWWSGGSPTRATSRSRSTCCGTGGSTAASPTPSSGRSSPAATRWWCCPTTRGATRCC